MNVLGANVAKQCLEDGELDEVPVFVAPILLGDGVRLFDHPGGTKVLLEPLDPGRVGALQHWYGVRRCQRGIRWCARVPGRVTAHS